MSNLQVLAQQQNVGRVVDGRWTPARATRDGAAMTADWFMALALEGRCFVANGGTDTSPITFAGAYDADAGDLCIDVPDGTAILPITVEAVIQTSGASLFEVIALASRTLVAATAGQFTAVTPSPLRTDAPIATGTTVVAAVAAGQMTDPNTSGSYEFFRSGYPTDPDVAGNPNPRYSFSALQDGIAPIIVGAGSLTVYVAGTAGTGFITTIWAELPESAIA